MSKSVQYQGTWNPYPVTTAAPAAQPEGWQAETARKVTVAWSRPVADDSYLFPFTFVVTFPNGWPDVPAAIARRVRLPRADRDELLFQPAAPVIAAPWGWDGAELYRPAPRRPRALEATFSFVLFAPVWGWDAETVRVLDRRRPVALVAELFFQPAVPVAPVFGWEPTDLAPVAKIRRPKADGTDSPFFFLTVPPVVVTPFRVIPITDSFSPGSSLTGQDAPDSSLTGG